MLMIMLHSSEERKKKNWHDFAYVLDLGLPSTYVSNET